MRETASSDECGKREERDCNHEAERRAAVDVGEIVDRRHRTTVPDRCSPRAMDAATA